MRLTRVPYLLIWLVLMVAQLWCLGQIDAWGGPAALGAIFAVQVLKCLVAIPRLNDLGASPDDALLGMVPLMSLGLLARLAGKTPSDKARERERSSWVDEPGALRLFADGADTLVRYPLISLGLVLPASALAIGLDLYGVGWFLALPSTLSDGGATLSLVLFAAAVFFGLYFLVQLGKRDSASRASWWPTLLVPPLLLAGMAVRMGGAGAFSVDMFLNPQGSPDLIPILLATQAMWFFFAFTVGGVLATAWAAVAKHSLYGGEDVLPRVKRRWLDVTVAYGAANIAITVGMLILVPGIIYALQYAFVPVVALEEPNEHALRFSAASSRNLRRRLFKLLFIAFAVDMLTAVGVFAIGVFALGAPMSTLGMGVGWKLGQFPPGLVGASPLLMVGLVALATWVWGAARIGVARCWLLRNPPATEAVEQVA